MTNLTQIHLEFSDIKYIRTDTDDHFIVCCVSNLVKGHNDTDKYFYHEED